MQKFSLVLSFITTTVHFHKIILWKAYLTLLVTTLKKQLQSQLTANFRTNILDQINQKVAIQKRFFLFGFLIKIVFIIIIKIKLT